MKIAAYIIIGLVALIFILFFVLGKKSQSGQALGLVDGKLAPCPSKPNCVSSEDATPDGAKIAAFKSSDLDALKVALVSQGGRITKDTSGYVSVEFQSGLFKFVDDVELRLDGEDVHIRSGSRVGYSDRGVNRKRVAALRVAL